VIQAKSATRDQQTPYATSGDFCRIFAEDMSGLYLLALLLTGEEQTAEQCFVCSLDDAMNGGPVFKDWARSWARRTVVRNAIGLLSPKPGERKQAIRVEDTAIVHTPGTARTYLLGLKALLELPLFDRFVFVITVLEGIRVHECSLLLECSPREVVSARRRVLEALGARERNWPSSPRIFAAGSSGLTSNQLL
jgi:hypothetical protein